MTLLTMLCPACQRPLNWSDAANTLWCAYGPCASNAANDGAVADTPHAAFPLLEKQIAIEEEKRELELA